MGIKLQPVWRPTPLPPRKPYSGRRDVRAWDDAEVRQWARRVICHPTWAKCGLAKAVLRLLNEHEVLTLLSENLALERDQLKQKLLEGT